MSATFGTSFKVTIFGESHGKAIGVTIDGIPPGIELDMDQVSFEMKRRAPGQNKLSTPRKEEDIPDILSGMLDGKTTGAPLTAVIHNTNTKSKDYSEMKKKMRPGQADYPARMRYDGFNDYRGSGKFSGRITAPIVFAGSIAKQILDQSGITIGAHIGSVMDVHDERLTLDNVTPELLKSFGNVHLPLIDQSKEKEIESVIEAARNEGDSVGGTIECMAIGLPAGIGNPFFNSIESVLSHLLFSVPAVKGIEFGSGFEMANMYASEANDAYYYDDVGNIKTKTNHNGGITGGISNGMPVVFRVAVKAPSSITKTQDTVNIESGENVTLEVHGRHDPIIVPRAIPVIEAVCAIGILDLMQTR